MRSLLLLAAAASLAAAPLPADETVSHPFASSVPRGSVRRVIVDVPTGEIEVRTGAADQIRLSGSIHRSCDFGERQEAQRIVDDIDVQIEVDGHDAIVERRFGPNAPNWRTRTWRNGYRIQLEVPPHIDLRLETRFGEVRLDGQFGDVDVDLRAGEIDARLPRASVHTLDASVRVGEVHADFGEDREDHEGIFPGRMHFLNVAGTARVNLHTTFGELRVTLTR